MSDLFTCHRADGRRIWRDLPMLCPNCKTPLSIADRSGIEIDFCPTCRGVWLDRGELDKIIERSASAVVPAREAPTQHAPQSYDYGRDASSHHDHYRGKRKKSFLSDIFDFD
jgi:Zn-finger nucleic acid-binding protein